MHAKVRRFVVVHSAHTRRVSVEAADGWTRQWADGHASQIREALDAIGGSIQAHKFVTDPAPWEATRPDGVVTPSLVAARFVQLMRAALPEEEFEATTISR